MGERERRAQLLEWISYFHKAPFYWDSHTEITQPSNKRNFLHMKDNMGRPLFYTNRNKS